MSKMISLLAASSGLTLAIGFMSDASPVVLVDTENGPVRVNKSDFDADQALPTGERQFKPYKGKDEPEQSAPAGAAIEAGGNNPPLAAPSAPDFSGPRDTPPAVDPLKNAAAQTSPSPNQRLVMKMPNNAKGRFYVVDGKGEKITDLKPQIDPEGYDTEELAWTAIRAVPH